MQGALMDQKGRIKTLWHLSWPAIIEQVLGTMVSYVCLLYTSPSPRDRG